MTRELLTRARRWAAHLAIDVAALRLGVIRRDLPPEVSAFASHSVSLWFPS